MVELLIIADDFTGALDTGVQFSKRGIETQVLTGGMIPIEALSATVRVVVIDTETRPLPRQEAYNIVKSIAIQATVMGIPVIYKKTDSALRGHVGSELEAVLDGTGEKVLCYIPALPDAHRVTKNGMQYVDGLPLEKSSFGQDPFDPMTCSGVADIIRKETECEVLLVRAEEELCDCETRKHILVFDAESNGDIWKRGQELKHKKKLHLLAGCAGFAAILPELLGLSGELQKGLYRTECFYVACGSLNSVTEAQVEYAQTHGFYRKNLRPEQKLCPEYYGTVIGQQFLHELKKQCVQRKKVIVDTFDMPEGQSTMEYAREHDIDNIRFSISACHGKIVRYLVEDNDKFTILMTGGDTLMGFMKEIGVNQLHPVTELDQGTVLSRLYWRGKRIQVVSKSGGFGSKSILSDIADRLVRESESTDWSCPYILQGE